MSRYAYNSLRPYWVALMFIVIAIVFRVFSLNDICPSLFGIARSVIYLCMFTVWGISVSRRIIHSQVRGCLIAAACLMVFWIFIRAIKYLILSPLYIAAARYAWYLYYLPMLFIPLLGLLIALSLGTPENRRLPKWTLLLCILAALLLLLVLTNDLHQCVFAFGSEPFCDKDYTYRFGYWLVAIWMLICTATALVTMIIKCRLPQKRRMLWLPLLPVAGVLEYALFYILRIKWVHMLFGDMPVVLCLLTISILESCIHCGLIRSNTGYDLLFLNSSINARITDENYRLRFSSLNAVEYPPETLRQTENGTLSPSRGILLKSHPIRAGHVIWQEDVSELADIMVRLHENCEEIASANEVERENYLTEKKLNRLREQNRLYDLIQDRTSSQYEYMNRALDGYFASESETERRRLLARAAVLGAYIKRRGNLILLSEKEDRLPIKELSLCLNESVQNLELLGTDCEYTTKLSGTVPISMIIRIYDLFEHIVEAAFELLRGLWIHISERDGVIIARMEAVSDAELSDVGQSDGAEVRREDDGSYIFVLRFDKEERL